MKGARKNRSTRKTNTRVSTQRFSTSSSPSSHAILRSNTSPVKSTAAPSSRVKVTVNHQSSASIHTRSQSSTASVSKRRTFSSPSESPAITKLSIPMTPITTPKRSFYLEAEHPSITIHSPETAPGENGLSPHTIRVKTLYRKMVREYYNHYGFDLDLFYMKVGELRNEFEKHRNEQDYGTINTLIKEAEVFLHVTEYADPYRPLTHKQGGLYGRNRPLPREFLRPDPPVQNSLVDYSIEEMTIRYLHDPENNPLPTGQQTPEEAKASV